MPQTNKTSSICHRMEVSPSQLTFDFGSNQPFCCFTIRNNSKINVQAFKLKTTNSKAYTVKPNRGLLKPQECIAIIARMVPRRRKELLIAGDFTFRDLFLLEFALVDDGFSEEYDRIREMDDYQRIRRNLLDELWEEQTTDVQKIRFGGRIIPPACYEIKLYRKTKSSLLALIKPPLIVRTFKPVFVDPNPILLQMHSKKNKQYALPTRITLTNCSSNFMAYKLRQITNNTLFQTRELRLDPAEDIIPPRTTVYVRIRVITLVEEEGDHIGSSSQQPPQRTPVHGEDEDDEEMLNHVSLHSEELALAEESLLLVSTPIQDQDMLEQLVRGKRLDRHNRTLVESVWRTATRDDLWVEAVPCHLVKVTRHVYPNRFITMQEAGGASSLSGGKVKSTSFFKRLGGLFHRFTSSIPIRLS